MITLIFGIGDSLALPKRVNLSLELGTIVWFSLSFIPNFRYLLHLRPTPKRGFKNFRLEAKFLFPPPQGKGLNVVVGGGRVESYF